MVYRTTELFHFVGEALLIHIALGIITYLPYLFLVLELLQIQVFDP